MSVHRSMFRASLRRPEFVSEKVGELGSAAYSSTDQTIPTGSVTRIELDTEIYDDEGELDLANNRIVVNEDGRYLLQGRVMSADVGAGNRIVLMLYAGGIRVDRWQIGSTGMDEHAYVGETVELVAGDAVYLNFYQNSGGDLTVYGNREDTWLAVNKLG